MPIYIAAVTISKPENPQQPAALDLSVSQYNIVLLNRVILMSPNPNVVVKPSIVSMLCLRFP